MGKALQITENLLLNKTCTNCKFAAGLADRDFVINKPEQFKFLSGIDVSEIHENAYLVKDVLFWCCQNSIIIPKELTCSNWVVSNE